MADCPSIAPVPRPSVAVWLASALILALGVWHAMAGFVILRHGDDTGAAIMFGLPLLPGANPLLHGWLAIVAALLVGACQCIGVLRRNAGFSLIAAVASLGLGIVGFFVPHAIPLLEHASEGLRDLILAACLFAGVVMLRWSTRLPVVTAPREP